MEGASPFKANCYGITPFHLLCANRIFNEYEYNWRRPRLRSRSLSMNSPNSKRKAENNLKFCCNENNNGDISDCTDSDDDDEADSSEAFMRGYSEPIIEEFLNHKPLASSDNIVNCQDIWGNTPLTVAIANRQWGVARILLQAGADMNIPAVLILTSPSSKAQSK